MFTVNSVIPKAYNWRYSYRKSACVCSYNIYIYIYIYIYTVDNGLKVINNKKVHKTYVLYGIILPYNKYKELCYMAVWTH